MPISANLSFGSSGLPSSAGSIAEKAAQLISNIQSKFERRNAIRYKVSTVMDHKFESILLKELTYCSQCRHLIWGLVGQACKLCKLTAHKRCMESTSWPCPEGPTACFKIINNKSEQNSRHFHKFKRDYFLRPTFCDHCGILIKGITSRQGLACDGGCGMKVHYDCEKFVHKYSCHQKVAAKAYEQAQVNDASTTKNWSSLVNISDFDILRVLGTGSFSKVYLARLRPSGQEYAIKVMKKTNLVISSDPESALTEMRILNLGRQYPFLIIAHCCFQSEDRLFFVMEHVVGRDLVYHLGKFRKFTEDQTRFYSAEIVLALAFLHKQGVVYRDLKLDNVILDKHGHCKLLDFGMSKDLSKTVNRKTRTFCGTPSYISPEIIKELDYAFSVDWWSLGVLMFEMLIGYSPFEAENEDQLYQLIVNEEIRFPNFLSYEAKSVLSGLLTKDPQDRLGCRDIEGGIWELQNHPFFLFRDNDGNRYFKWDAMETKQIEPPYRPSAEDLQLVGNNCTEEQNTAVLTPSSPDQLKKIAQAEFSGFSFYSESFKTVVQ